MVFERTAKIREQYTDKYVVVDADRPELARFAGVVGLVKTVNMSGRALVEFLDFHLNVGWHDIEINYLKVVDKPPPKEKKAAAKPKPAAKKPAPAKPAAAGEKKLSPLELARMQGASKSGGPSAPAKPATAKAGRSKMSVADMIAAARSGKSGGTATAPAKDEPAAEQPPAAVEETPDEEPPAPVKPPAAGKVDRTSMSVDEKIAWCREHDGK